MLSWAGLIWAVLLVLRVVTLIAGFQLHASLLSLSLFLLLFLFYHIVLSQGHFSPCGLSRRIAGLTWWLRASRSAKTEATRPS